MSFFMYLRKYHLVARQVYNLKVMALRRNGTDRASELATNRV